MQSQDLSYANTVSVLNSNASSFLFDQFLYLSISFSFMLTIQSHNKKRLNLIIYTEHHQLIKVPIQACISEYENKYMFLGA